jgi:hypothetical protein
MNTIPPPPSLNGSHLRTFEKIFAHPASHNLAWRDVFAMFTHLGAIVEEDKNQLRITLHGHSLNLSEPRTKEVASVDELLKLRHLLQSSEASPSIPPQAVDHFLVVIDHQRARLFSAEMNGTVPHVIHPYAPEEYFRQAHDDRDYFSGKVKPAPGSYFEPVAKALKNARKILLFGTGTGTSSEMELFTGWLKKHHPDLAARITGTLTIDEQHLTEAQLLAKAREFYGTTTTA